MDFVWLLDSLNTGVMLVMLAMCCVLNGCSMYMYTRNKSVCLLSFCAVGHERGGLSKTFCVLQRSIEAGTVVSLS